VVVGDLSTKGSGSNALIWKPFKVELLWSTKTAGE
jgi:hypothetical protein